MVKKAKDVSLPIVEQNWFNALLCCVVLLNAVVIYLETDHVVSTFALDVINDIFLIIYVLELCMRLISLGGETYFSDHFNVLDFFLVILGLMERIFFQGQIEEASIMRVLRLLRLGRLARLVRLIRFFTSLWLTVIGFYNALRTLFSVLPILLIMCFFFALFARMLLGSTTVWTFSDSNSPPFVDFKNTVYFGSVGASMVSMWQIVTLSNWTGISRPVVEKYPHTALFFIFFIFLTAFGLLSIVTGIICLSSVKNANDKTEYQNLLLQAKRTEIIHAIADCFSLADIDGSGSLDNQEVASFISRPQGKSAWTCLGLPLDDVVLVLQSFDTNNDGKITRDEFVNGALKIMGESKPKDIVKVLFQTQALSMRVSDFAERLKVTKREMLEFTRMMTTAFESIDGELRRKMDPRQYRQGRMVPVLRKQAAQTRVASESDFRCEQPVSETPEKCLDTYLETCLEACPEADDRPDVEITVDDSDRLRDHASRHFLPPGCPPLMKFFKRTPASVLETSITQAREKEFRAVVRAAQALP